MSAEESSLQLPEVHAGSQQGLFSGTPGLRCSPLPGSCSPFLPPMWGTRPRPAPLPQDTAGIGNRTVPEGLGLGAGPGHPQQSKVTLETRHFSEWGFWGCHTISMPLALSLGWASAHAPTHGLDTVQLHPAAPPRALSEEGPRFLHCRQQPRLWLEPPSLEGTTEH